MSKIEEIISKINNAEWDGEGDPMYSYDQVIEITKQVADVAFEAGRESQYEYDMCVRNGTPITAPNKQQFIDNLFKK